MNREELMEYLRGNELDVQSARSMFLFAERVFGSYVDSDVVHGENFSPVIFSFSADRFYQLIARSVIDNTARKVYKDFLVDEGSLDKLIAGHRQYEFLMDELWDKILANIAEADLEALKGYYSELMFLSERWWHYAAIGEDKGGLVERELVPEFAKRHEVSEVGALEIIGILSHPDEPAMFTRERKEFFELCVLKLESEAGFVSRAEEFAREYFWKDTDFFERRVVDLDSVMADVEKEIKGKSLEEIKRELGEIGREAKVIKERKKALRTKYNLEEGDEKIITFNRKMTQWQDWRKLGMMKNTYYIFYLLEVLAEKLGVSYEDLAYSTLGELDKIFSGEGQINQEAIVQRKAGAVFVFVKGEPLVELGREAYREVMEFIEEGAGGEELAGTVASAGRGNPKKVEGKARIIINPLKEEFKEGEILVTSMTRVEFVPLMRRAKAIITDEGGITTHAAIVSRELGIPCIIGTRRATKILKDGDMVELDMAKGVIRTR